MTANGSLQLVSNVFGSGKNGILTRWGTNSTGMFSTTQPITLGGTTDGSGIEFTIYFLGKNAQINNTTSVGLFSFGLATPTLRGTNYHAEFTRYAADTVGAIITPGALTYVTGGNEPFWIGTIGTRDLNTYPKYQNTFEVWCITKLKGVDTPEIYLNNQLLSTSNIVSWNNNITTWAKRASGYWQLGDGATMLARDNGLGQGTYIGAFQVYNKYHSYESRRAVFRSLMSTFYIPTTANNIIDTTFSGTITANTRTSTFTITINDYPHSNVQSLSDFYVFFAPQYLIPTSINIFENNVTLIDISVNNFLKLTCTAFTRNYGTQVLCLAISSPGSANIDPTTKILTYNIGTFTSV
jgi:hypothetical protein